ncbi:MAG: MnmC family methyltransferase [Planctomycetota bacterium]
MSSAPQEYAPGWVLTGDGSYTLRSRATGELFHNEAGAWTEARQHYAGPALAGIAGEVGPHWSWLDSCFGLGYGSLALLHGLLQLRQPPERVQIVAIERDRGLAPLWPEILAQPALESAGLPALQTVREDPDQAHYQLVSAATQIDLHLHFDDLRRVLPRLAPMRPFDRVLHDPFSPRGHAELWSLEVFQHFHRLLHPEHGRLCTYSTAIAVLGGLRAAGFTPYRTPGLGIKRGGTCALTAPRPGPLPAGLAELDPEDVRQLACRSGLPFRDPAFDRDHLTVMRERNEEQRRSPLPSRKAGPQSDPPPATFP